jgi:membrane-bound lytic murein transglycosylase B
LIRSSSFWRAVLAIFAVAVSFGTQASLALDTARPAVQEFIERMSEQHAFDREALAAVLAQAEVKQSVLDLMARPAERALLWHEYRARFVTAQRAKEGVEFWQQHRELLDRISHKYGVPPEYMVAILGVETYYGRITGKDRVIDALATLAFDYPPRSTYFTGELEEFLLLTREEASDPLQPLGSYAGAMGPPQFMPRSIRKFAVDENGDGRRNLREDWEDILGSIANYFVEHGWLRDQPVIAEAGIDHDRAHDIDPRRLALEDTVAGLRDKGVVFETALPEDAPALLVAADEANHVRFRVGFRNFYTITRYNRSPLYAMAVHDLATTLARSVRSDDAPEPSEDGPPDVGPGAPTQVEAATADPPAVNDAGG